MSEPITIKINEVEYVRKDTIPTPESSKDAFPYQIGKKYFLRTVTNYYVGKLIWVGPQELLLEDVSWIADTGRFSDALKKGELNEVEPYPEIPVIIGRGAIVDASIWDHSRKLVQK